VRRMSVDRLGRPVRGKSVTCRLTARISRVSDPQLPVIDRE
jgi:hypothetical protein